MVCYGILWSGQLDICWNIFTKQGNAHDGILEETWKSGGKTAEFNFVCAQARKTVENWIQWKRLSGVSVKILTWL